MSSPSKSPKLKASLLNRLQNFHFGDTGHGSGNSNTISTAIRRAAPVLGAVGSLAITSQKSGNLVKPPTSQTWIAFRLALNKLHGCEYFGVLSPLKPAIGALCTCLELVEMADNDEEQKRMLSGLIKITVSLEQYMEDSNCNAKPEVINQAVKSLDRCVARIQSKQGGSAARRFAEAQLRQEEIMQCCEEIERILQHLQIEITLTSLKLLDELSVNNKLGLLNPSKQARYDSESSARADSKGCTPDTRKEILLDLDSWSNTKSGPHLRWMSGMAGTGKTTIAFTHSRTLDKRRNLAASFFCSRKSPDCRNVGRIIPTIAYQLARFSKPFRAQLCAALSEDPDLGHSNIPKQFECLLRAPFQKIGYMAENNVVIVDALDECDSPHLVGIFLDHLIECAAELPLKFLVTSRPEPEIYSRMMSYYSSKSLEPTKPLHEMDKSLVQGDIKLYLKGGLASMSVSDDQLEELVQQCDSLFIYAATLLRYIRPGDRSVPSDTRLKDIISMTSGSKKRHAELDSLYAVVLGAAIGDDLEKHEADNVQVVLKTVLCAQEPISTEIIAALCGFDDTSIPSFALERLRSVIYVSDTNGLVSVFHASFPDYIFDQERSGALFCDRATHHSLMTKQCFKLMRKLRFNNYLIESSYAPDHNDETEAQVDIDDAIKPSLWYACQYWADHLHWATILDNLLKETEDFLSQRLLFWMEVLNQKRSMALGADILLKASLRLAESRVDDDLATLVEDSRNFVTSFAASPASISTPHIYTSLLPFCPRSSSVYQIYRKHLKGLVEPDQHAMHVREVAPLASWRLDSEILSVAYSHDGTRIAFGCVDGTVGVQSSYDGTSIFNTARDQSHDQSVWSVAFSPHKGKLSHHDYIVSGSDDRTIRTWNLLDGTARVIIGPLSGEIKCVATSPGGAIASGSSDCTVRIWDSTDGKLIAGPLLGHDGEVWSVAFSPDGTVVASGSDDHTIRIWNSSNGQLILGPLTAQEGEINTVAFSLDGTRMASGSSDTTICVWDPHKGTVISGPFTAHNTRVSSVAFSPNGKYLASGSYDRTIRVWDPLTGRLTAGPFEGHIGPVYTIAFSPDSTRIISGSPDGTIRLWDPRRGKPDDGVLECHSDAVSSVSFSPDGLHMASCSYDGTLRIWAIHDNTPVPVGDPLRGHTDNVLCLAFTHDGARIVTGSADETARVWDIFNESAPPVVFQGHSSAIWSVTFSPDGRFVASAGGPDDTTIRLWESSTGTPIANPLQGHTDEVLSVAISPDGTTLTSGSRDTTLRVWDLENMVALRLLKGHTRAVWTVVYSHDGTKLASCSSDGTIRIWDSHNGALIAGPIAACSDRVSSVAFSLDNNFIASGADDCTIRLWDLITGELVGGPYEGHHDVIWSVAFSPGGTHIASGSHDGTIRIWDINNNEPMVSKGDTGINAIAGGHWKLHPDGWIKHGSDLLLWVPHEVARSLLTPHCSSVISSCGPLRIDFSNLKLGNSWKDCYEPQPVDPSGF